MMQNPFPGKCGVVVLLFAVVFSVSCGKNAAQTVGEIRQSPLLADAVDNQPRIFGVRVKGIISTPLCWDFSAGEYLFFIQDTKSQADGDSSASDGIAVYCGTNCFVSSGDDMALPAQGDEVVIRGMIHSQHGEVRMLTPRFISRKRRQLPLADLIAIEELSLPSDLQDVHKYWRAKSGMLCTLSKGAVCQGPAHRGTVYMIDGNYPVATRRKIGENRVFRDAHPLDDLPGINDNQNANRFELVLADTNMNSALEHVQTFSTLANNVTGVFHVVNGRPLLRVIGEPLFNRGVDPSSLRPVVVPEPGEWRIATYNVENLYDWRDDPFDSRDTRHTPGSDRPNDYVPENPQVYEKKLAGLAKQIVEDLNSPDIIALQEIEDQDIVRPDGIATFNSYDGMADVLQDLIRAIRQAGGPPYRSLVNRHGADKRGILCAYIYRPEQVVPAQDPDDAIGVKEGRVVDASDYLVTYSSGVENPRAYNMMQREIGLVSKRAVQVGAFAVRGRPFYLLNVHYKSRPDKHVDIRKAQAQLCAMLVERIQMVDPEAWIAVAGDFNVFPRPDEPIPDQPQDQLGQLYDAGLVNLYDVAVHADAKTAYTYIFRGQAQTLDQIFVTPSLRESLRDVWIAHINADYPALMSDRRGYSDHDPVVAGFYVPKID